MCGGVPSWTRGLHPGVFAGSRHSLQPDGRCTRSRKNMPPLPRLEAFDRLAEHGLRRAQQERMRQQERQPNQTSRSSPRSSTSVPLIPVATTAHSPSQPSPTSDDSSNNIANSATRTHLIESAKAVLTALFAAWRRHTATMRLRTANNKRAPRLCKLVPAGAPPCAA